MLTAIEYIRVESLYVQAVIEFLFALEIPYLEVHTLTKWREKLEITNHQELYTDSMNDLYIKIAEGSLLERSDIIELIRLVLRDELGCKLKYQQELEVHFGCDYYMYVIAAKECCQALDKIKQLGLYVEWYESPYIEE